MAARGRPLTYTAEIAELICDRIARGEPLRAICRDEELPQESTVRGWAVDNVDGFAARYARAREIQYHGMAEELIDIADDARNDWMERQADGGGVGYELNGEHVQRSRLRTDTRKWLLSKMLPKVYGDKIEVDQTVRTATVSDEPLTEDEWNREQQRQAGSLAPATRSATRTD